jgi:hypothetical protein
MRLDGAHVAGWQLKVGLHWATRKVDDKNPILSCRASTRAKPEPTASEENDPVT